MSELPRSSLKTGAIAKKQSMSPSKIKRVTFKTPVQNGSTPRRAADQLSMAMSKIYDVMRAETRAHKLLTDVKNLYQKYHAQCLIRYNLEKLLAQKMQERHDDSLKLLEETQKNYFQIISKFSKK
uniref:Uncharacterized protein n=1 Tax=Ditylenchus dipsaci TaxID=166011 RepID=A0A915CZ88_9BILA